MSQDKKLKTFVDACRKAGLRLTPQRIEIYRELAAAQDHPSAETLHTRLAEKMPTLSLDTVYRTLGTLTDYGLVHKVETVESQARFEACHDLHHHLVCNSCKQIVDFDWRLIDQAVLPEEINAWGRVEKKSLIAYGVCKSCLIGE